MLRASTRCVVPVTRGARAASPRPIDSAPVTEILYTDGVARVAPRPMAPDAFATLVRDDIARWTRIARERKIDLDA